jgi:hypothetical protein
MNVSISGELLVQPIAAPTPSHASAVSDRPPSATNDTVTLSQTAQINNLYGQGHSPSQIAQYLGLSLAVINLDLGVAGSVTSTPLT